MRRKVAQTHIHREDGIYFVSTINRESSSMFAHGMTYAETMAWGPNTAGPAGDGDDGRGPIVFQASSGTGSITGHLYVCGMIHKHGKDAQAIADKGAEDE